MIAFNWHEVYPAAAPATLHGTGLESPAKARYAVSDRALATQLDALLATGLRLGLAEAGAAVVLTFDDGGRSNKELAWELLRARGLRAHFFVCPALLGRPGFLSPADVRELAAAGNAVGSHGLHHRSLTALSEAELCLELTGSRTALEALLGVPCTSLALPYGTRNARVLRAIWDAGYRSVFTSSLPGARSGQVIGRYTVRAGWPSWYLAALAEQRPAAKGFELTCLAAGALFDRLQQRLRPAPRAAASVLSLAALVLA